MKTKRLWNNSNIEVVEIDGRWFALDGWNGECYLNCWETDENTFNIEDGKHYQLMPVYDGIGEPDEDGNYDQYEIVNYEII